MSVFAIVGYASCSSIMLVINKVAVHFLPAPGFVLFAQCMSSWIAVKLAGLLGLIDVDELEWPKAKAFFPVAAAFLACIFANIKTLQFANVETFVVFRASTPLVIGIAEWWFMGRELPNARSAAAMLTLCAGAVFYVLTDASFKVDPDVSLGYAWVVVWYVIFSFDQLYIKHAVDTVKMRSNWGRVYYTNLWASILLFWLTLATEPQTLTAMQWTFKPVAALSLSCAAGVAMSYFAFLCRAAVSATSFTVIGNVCKVLAPRTTCRGRLHLPRKIASPPCCSGRSAHCCAPCAQVVTILINVSIWDKHASIEGLGALFLCLVAAAAYEQAPFRRKEAASEKERILQSEVEMGLGKDDVGESDTERAASSPERARPR